MVYSQVWLNLPMDDHHFDYIRKFIKITLMGEMHLVGNNKHIRVICKVTLCLGLLSPPIPSFSGIHKIRKILSNLSMKCWNSLYKVGAVKVYVAAVEALRKKERQDETQFSLLPKLVEKPVWVPIIWFCKIFIPRYTHLMPSYAETGHSRPLIAWLYG